MRKSPQRETVYSVVSSTTSHPDAYWVYEKAREIIPDISLGTVYRNLGQLTESGDLITIETDEGVVHYDARTTFHAHFICEKCGKITDLFIEPHSEEVEKFGYTVKKEKRVYYGVCKDCNQTENQKN